MTEGTNRNSQAGASSGSHLIVCVNYLCDEETATFVRHVRQSPAADRFHIAVADNSPARSDQLVALADATPGTSYRHFPQNPGYAGAARLVLASLIGTGKKIAFETVTLCNVDIEFDPRQYLEVVEAATTVDPTRTWVLGPDVAEDGRTYRANPHVANPPEKARKSLGHLLRLTYPTFAAYRKLYARKRATAINEFADTWPAWQPIYSCHGSFMIFGDGYFRAGGSFPEGPLFEEEHAIAEIARIIGCPIYYCPELHVQHQGELTTGVASRRRYKLYRRAADFYANWDPNFCIGTMTEWFEPLSALETTR